MTGGSTLFEPYRLNGLALRNRFAMAPMTRSLSPGGVPGEDVSEYYARRAAGGVGLIITEGTYVNSAATVVDPAVPRFFGADALAGWRRVVERVHAEGGHIVPQLWHVGIVETRGSTLNVTLESAYRPELGQTGPSGILAPDQAVGQPMTLQQIDAVTDAFAQAAVDAQSIGFDGVEVHAAHGYLVDQFFWSTTNRRSDEYGGDFRRRGRFAGEIVAEMRRRVGPDFPIILRISQWKQGHYDARIADRPGELGEVLETSVDAGVDMFHCSQRRFWEPIFADDPRNLSGWVKHLTGRPTMTVGSVGIDRELIDTLYRGGRGTHRDLAAMFAMFERGEFDMVAVGRALIGDPGWVDKVRSGRTGELQPFDADLLSELL